MNAGKAESKPVFVKSTGVKILNTIEKDDDVHSKKSDKKFLSDVMENVATSGTTSSGKGVSADKKVKPPVVSHPQSYNRVSSHQLNKKMNQKYPDLSRRKRASRKNDVQKHRSNQYNVVRNDTTSPRTSQSEHQQKNQIHSNRSRMNGGFRRNVVQKHQGHSQQLRKTIQKFEDQSRSCDSYRKNVVQKQRGNYHHVAKNVVHNVTTPRRTLQPGHRMKHQVKSFHNYICFHCNEMGHIKRFCRKLQHRRSYRPIAQKFPRKIWVKKDDIGFAYPYLKEISEQMSSSNRCSHYLASEGGDVKSGGRRFKELWPRPGSCALF